MTKLTRHSKGHWRCPDCGDWCNCSDETVILLPHKRCGAARQRGGAWKYVESPATAIEKGHTPPPEPAPLRTHDTMSGQ